MQSTWRRRGVPIIAAALGLAAVLLLLAAAPSPAQAAARPATAKQKVRVAKVVAPSVRRAFPQAPPGFGKCFVLDRTLKRSTKYPRHLFGWVGYRRGTGACAGEDRSYSFVGFWKLQGRRTLFRGGHNPGPVLRASLPGAAGGPARDVPGLPGAAALLRGAGEARPAYGWSRPRPGLVLTSVPPIRE